MDNHRAALWCWLKHVAHGTKHGLFHIDAHYDAATVSNEHLENLPDLASISFEDYLSISIPGVMGEAVPLIRWDNYLFAFESLYREKIGNFFVATHEIGTPPPDTTHWEEIHMSKLPEQFLDFLTDYGDEGWLLNIDLDYFFSRQPDKLQLIHSESYIQKIFSAIKKHLASGQISCLTISLSPECCGGWEPAEEMCYKLCDELGIDFRLPKNA